MKRLEGQAQQEKAQSMRALQSERKRQKGLVDAALARATAAESEVKTLRQAQQALQRELEVCRREAIPLPQAAAQVRALVRQRLPCNPKPQMSDALRPSHASGSTGTNSVITVLCVCLWPQLNLGIKARFSRPDDPHCRSAKSLLPTRQSQRCLL